MRNLADIALRNLASTAISNSTAPVRPLTITHSSQSLSKKMTMIGASGGYKRSFKVTVFTHIKAPVEVCFDLVTKQFEETPRWDPIIRCVIPISQEFIGVGSKSRVIFDLAGSIEESIIVLRTFVPNKVLVWTSDNSIKLQEEWHFGRQPDGTLVVVTISYNPSRGLLKYFNKWTRTNGHVEQVVSEMLRRLKMAAELPNHRWSDKTIALTSH